MRVRDRCLCGAPFEPLLPAFKNAICTSTRDPVIRLASNSDLRYSCATVKEFRGLKTLEIVFDRSNGDWATSYCMD